ncbi:hypothetical protein [Agromyces indicus]|uniref:HNH endonuclease n=1 Tax=Agromyces indicus TaxID=758919 RepID=A0ABU1FH31_9MICO|nr:hypothetical protein [Agromyces indicus]MDR5691063.1 hypothetical protein [Agromyces indicus]
MSGYERVHQELKARRGNAVGRRCVAPGCTRLADGWGLVGDEGTLRFSEDGHGKRVRWSDDLADYKPLCMTHNNQLDHGGDWLLCPRGHSRAAFGVAADGMCRRCKSERSREDRERGGDQYRARNRERMRARRAAMSADELERLRARQRENNRSYRARKRAAASSTKTLHADSAQ